MTQADSDSQLIKRIAARDRLAVRVLFSRYQLRLFRFIVRIVRNEAMAEELVNEVFLEVWRQAGCFSGRSSVSTWMLTIARNKAISLLRRRSESAIDETMASRLPDGSDTPEETAQKRSKSRIMRECIERLPDIHREVIDLVYYHEKSIREVSEIVGIPENTVKSRMFNARRAYAILLRQAGVDRQWP